MWADFKAFLVKTNALALAIGVIIGVALGGVVTSLVEDVIMPPVGLLLGRVDFNELKVVLQAASGDAKEVAIRYGAFLNAIISFIIVAFVAWQLGKSFVRADPEVPMKTCPFCKESNAIDATKCKYCASAI
jgi:large conductance mechanosensitive channel